MIVSGHLAVAIAALVLGADGLAVAGPAAAAPAPLVFVVDDRADLPDEAPADGACRTAAGTCTLRAAVQEASAGGKPAEVLVPEGRFVLTIPGGDEDASATGDLDVATFVTIRGAGRGTVVTSEVDRVLHVVPGGAGTVERLTIRDAAVDGSGGGVMNDGDLTLTEVLVTGNHAVGDGGGVFSGAGLVRVVRSTIAGNTAGNSGAGMLVAGPTVVVQSTFSGNRVPESFGGGADRGGAVRAIGFARLDVAFSTFARNSASGAGATIAVDEGAGARLTATIVAGAGPAADCDGAVRSGGGNLAADGSCGLSGAGDREGVGPDLGPLRYAGGPTPVHRPAAKSPAVDSLVASFPCPDRDQRGVRRPRDGDGDGVPACDRGAVER
jgi:hypothetical protein